MPLAPTPQDLHYLAQGYELPAGMTWEDVATSRAKHGTTPTLVPLATAPGCVCWGVPMIDGKFLDRLPV